MTAKTLPGFDFRHMCLAGMRAAEAAHANGFAETRCPSTGARLARDRHGIWSVGPSIRILGYRVQTDPSVPVDQVRLVQGQKVVARITNIGAPCHSAD